MCLATHTMLEKQLRNYFCTYWLYPFAAWGDFRRDFDVEKVQRNPLSEFTAGRKTRPCRETSGRARLFAGMEMTVDFDLTRWNLITLRTGTCSSGTRNEACRRSRVDDDGDGDVKVRYEIHRRSFPSEGPLDMYVSSRRRPKEIPISAWSDLLHLTTDTTWPVSICRIMLSKTMGLAPIPRCYPIRRLNNQNHRLRLLILP